MTFMKINFRKYSDNLAPAIVQDAVTNKVLMLGFMNEEALDKTITEGKVTFYSIKNKSLWNKGEVSCNLLLVKDVLPDCDNDTILIKADPTGPVCHTGSDTCWNEKNERPAEAFLSYLESVIEGRKSGNDENSYVKKMFGKGVNKIAHKVGEEAVEMIIEAKDNNDELFLGEAADLLFHYLLLLNAKGYNLQKVIAILQQRHSQ
jgi:phosphoribosyl-ATP pyrophosphohydrolase/phosphoribosyl-AMP cyclohydrolase